MPSRKRPRRRSRATPRRRPGAAPPPARRYVYRLVAGVMLVLALALVLWPPYDQRRLGMPDPWTYDFAMRNFAQGKWVVSDDEMARGRQEIRLAGGGRVIMYHQLAPNRWALRKSPGYPLLSIPFTVLNQARLTNAVLAILAAVALYAWLAAWRDEFVACLGTSLFLWTPISLVAMHNSTMDTFASGAILMIGGALVLWYDLKAGQGKYAGWQLLAAGLALGWSVVVRLQNAPVLLLLSLFTGWAVIRHHRAAPGRRWFHLGTFGLGLLSALTVLLAYNLTVFGRILDTGYRYGSLYQNLFLWEDNPAATIDGTSTWLATPSVASFFSALAGHLYQWTQPLLLGWPLLLLALFSLGLAIWQRNKSYPAAWSWLMGLWLLLTYAPYAGILYFGITRELAVPFFRGWGFFAVDRYLFPASLPLVFLTIALVARWPRWLAIGLTLVYVGGSAWLYGQVLSH